MVGLAAAASDGGPSHPAPWPLTLLDVPALRRSGVAATPFQRFLLKIHSRCNLACTYCYVYEGLDRGWRHRPPSMSPLTVHRTIARIAEHVRAHRLTDIQIGLHGGEPLLRGPGPLVALAETLRAALPDGCSLGVTVQTNGTLLTQAWLDRLAAAGIWVGLSLDGGEAALNSRRIDRAGRPSWPAAARAALLLADRPDCYAGILTTVDTASDPALVYESLLAMRPAALSFLLPHANWTTPPPAGAGRLSYGEWLCAVFDLWWQSEQPGPPVRLFHEIIGLLFGRPSTSEEVGLSPVALVVVETDGSIEQVGSLKCAYDGGAATGLDVFEHSFDMVLDHPGFAARQLGLAGLADQCRGCALVEVCGGGNYAHRYRRGDGFLHPSAYCADLELLIRHVAERVKAAVARLERTRPVTRQHGVNPTC